jgi:hypothetical protein
MSATLVTCEWKIATSSGSAARAPSAVIADRPVTMIAAPSAQNRIAVARPIPSFPQ